MQSNNYKKILLINPPSARWMYGSRFAIPMKPPLGLAYLAAYLEKNNINVKILDANAEMLKPEQVVKKIIQSDAEIIGFTSTTYTINQTFNICAQVKQKSDKTIIMGGPHVSFLPHLSLKQCPAIDIIIKGEGELTFFDLVKTLTEGKELNNVLGIAYQKNNEIISNPERPLIENLDSLPFPARHLLPIHLYKPANLMNIGAKGKEYTTLISSRGCPNKCTYCSSAFYWKKFRTRTVENMIAEIEYVLKTQPLKQICFLDDTLTIPQEKIEKLCDELIKKDWGLKWRCYARVNAMTEELARKMKRAGCFGLEFGIETGNEEILKKIKKHTTLKQARNAVKWCLEAGLKVMGDFMIGLPGDTKETINQTINFARQLSPHLAIFSITTPYPGTPLFQEMKEKNLIKQDEMDWTQMSMHGYSLYSNENLSYKEIQKLYSQAIRKFYLRPRFFFQISLFTLKHPYEFINYFKLAIRFFLNFFGVRK